MLTSDDMLSPWVFYLYPSTPIPHLPLWKWVICFCTVNPCILHFVVAETNQQVSSRCGVATRDMGASTVGAFHETKRADGVALFSPRSAPSQFLPRSHSGNQTYQAHHHDTSAFAFLALWVICFRVSTLSSDTSFFFIPTFNSTTY
jgi:hypothetical protein